MTTQSRLAQVTPVTRRAALGHTGALAAVLGLGGQPAPAWARASSPASAEGDQADPLVGAWQWNAYADNPELTTFALFHADGTYVEWQPVGGTAIGIWRASANGPGRYDLLFIFTDTDPSLDGYVPGTATFTITLALDEAGEALAAAGTVDVRDPDGVLLATVPWRRPATRLSFATNPATGSIPATVAPPPGGLATPGASPTAG